jgi:epoxyqueuosine reductase
MKQAIKEFAFDMGVDDVGVCSVKDYNSPRSPAIDTLFPAARSIVVLAFGELSGCEGGNPYIAMNGRLDLGTFSRSCSYRVARFIEKELRGKASTASNFPFDRRRGAIAELSLRHAAVAAGCGTFGRHNLVIHPDMGSRVLFAALLTNLELEPDPPIRENLCTECGICTAGCPGRALDEEGKTDLMKCMSASQPYGLRTHIGFWVKFGQSTPEERAKMLTDPEYQQLFQADSFGTQYFCFQCIASCPVGRGT